LKKIERTLEVLLLDRGAWAPGKGNCLSSLSPFYHQSDSLDVAIRGVLSLCEIFVYLGSSAEAVNKRG
jgi:hypothetical protein